MTKMLIALLTLCMSFIGFQSAFAEYREWCDSPGICHQQWDNGKIDLDSLGYLPVGNGPLDFNIGPDGRCKYDPTLFYHRHVLTSQDPDFLTKDSTLNNQPPAIMKDNQSGEMFTNANLDVVVNFGPFAYSSPAGSIFPLDIDRNGVYRLKKEELKFKFYDYFDYVDTTGAKPNEHYKTFFTFQPYSVSDGCGMCGTQCATSLNAFEIMGGQAQFDMAIDIFGGGKPMGTVIVTDLKMRGIGKITVIAKNGMQLTSTAASNNTNPVSGILDPYYYNRQTFVGGSIVQPVVYLDKDGDGIRETAFDNSKAAGGAFIGMPMLLRFNSKRIVTAVGVPGTGEKKTDLERQVQTRFNIMNDKEGGWIDRLADDTVIVTAGTVLKIEWKNGAGTGPDPSKVLLDGKPIDAGSSLTLTAKEPHELMLSNTANGGKDTDLIKIKIKNSGSSL